MNPSKLYCDHVTDNHKTTLITEMREDNVNEEGNLNPDVLIFQPKRISIYCFVKIKLYDRDRLI